jgi:hypothetical protein
VINVYVVMAGLPRGERWVDSMFVASSAADERVVELKSSWANAGFTVSSSAGWWVWRSVAKLQDAVLAEAIKKTP